MTGAPRVARRDLVIAGLFALVLIADVALSSRASGAFGSDAVLYGAAALALVWRRRFPVPALVACHAMVYAATLAGTNVVDLNASLLFLVLPGYAVGHYAEGRIAWAGLVLGIASVVGLTAISEPSITADNAAFPAGIEIAAFALGRLLRDRTLLTRTLADEAARLELERDRRAQAAVGEERARIAREMHDVVAHTMAIMVVQAGAARRVLDRDRAAAEQALATVEDTGRVALTELRRLLGFLRDDAPAALAPQPSLGEIGVLAQRARDAGLPVVLDVEGEPGELPAGAELAAYRIVQEALTNALKHGGPGARASVRLAWTRDGLEIEVADTGAGGPVAPSGGHGLIGMRERVAVHGGTLDAGPRPGGGFVVRASLPRGKVLA